MNQTVEMGGDREAAPGAMPAEQEHRTHDGEAHSHVFAHGKPAHERQPEPGPAPLLGSPYGGDHEDDARLQEVDRAEVGGVQRVVGEVAEADQRAGPGRDVASRKTEERQCSETEQQRLDHQQGFGPRQERVEGQEQVGAVLGVGSQAHHRFVAGTQRAVREHALEAAVDEVVADAQIEVRLDLVVPAHEVKAHEECVSGSRQCHDDERAVLSSELGNAVAEPAPDPAQGSRQAPRTVLGSEPLGNAIAADLVERDEGPRRAELERQEHGDEHGEQGLVL
jgi:hypothetical protein